MILLAYLIGGISPGYLLVRILLDTDLRTVGSGSLGATNVGRVLGKKGFYFTLAADILKGALMVWLARWLEFSPGVVAAVAVVVIRDISGRYGTIFTVVRGLPPVLVPLSHSITK